MALTLTSGITADADEFVVTGAVPNTIGPDYRFRIDDELLRLQGFGPDVSIRGDYARQWAPRDRNRWLVERGVDSTPASHVQGADIFAANDVFASSDDLTPPSPFDGGGGGDAGEQTVYVQPTDPGAVGAGKLWVDTTTDPPVVLRRTGPDDEWIDIFAEYQGASDVDLTASHGAAGDSGSDVRLNGGTGNDGATGGAQIIAEGGGETDDGYLRFKTPGFGGGAAIFGAAGTVPVNTDGLGRVGWGTLADISSALPEVPASPTEQDIVDALLALGLVTQAAP